MCARCVAATALLSISTVGAPSHQPRRTVAPNHRARWNVSIGCTRKLFRSPRLSSAFFFFFFFFSPVHAIDLFKKKKENLAAVNYNFPRVLVLLYDRREGGKYSWREIAIDADSFIADEHERLCTSSEPEG